MTQDSQDQAARLIEQAMAADAQGDADAGVRLLRQSIALQPHNPFAHYLLGADCASRGLNGDAVLHLTTAVEQAPQLHEARLQLALLWLTLDNPRTAGDVVRPLSQLPDTMALHHFGAALALIARDEGELACAGLRQGLAIGCDNPPLMGDMRTLLQRLENAGRDVRQDVDRQALQLGIAINAYAGGETDDR